MLQLRTHINTGSTTSSKDMGKNPPPYYPDFKISSWYSGNESFFYNMVGDKELFIQYGKNQPGWASAKFFNQTLEILEEEEQENGDIKARIKVTPKYFKGFKSNYSNQGYRVNYTVSVAGKVVYTFSGMTTDTINQGAKDPIYTDILVKPQEEYTGGAFKVDINYPDGQFTPAKLIVGIGVFNPNPVNYIPMGIRKGNKWLSLNKHNGYIKKRIGNSWKDYSKEDNNTSLKEGKGKNRIRINGKWYQLPIFKEE